MAVDEVWSKIAGEERDRFWDYLYGNMHTPATLPTHWNSRGS